MTLRKACSDTEQLSMTDQSQHGQIQRWEGPREGRDSGFRPPEKYVT